MEHNEHTNVIEIKTYAFEFTLIQTIENSQPRTNSWAVKVSALIGIHLWCNENSSSYFSCFPGFKKIGFLIQQTMILSQK
jgi:hypothetical protein